MIIHKLIAHHLKHKDDGGFYQLQADDAIEWIQNPAGGSGLASKPSIWAAVTVFSGPLWLGAAAM
jgi:hypothetical protein